jgi:hypothetical protein
MTSSAVSFEEVKAAMLAAPLRVVQHFLPAGKQVGDRWVVGGVHGAPGKSMTIELDGRKSLQWFDQATGEGGDAIDLAAAVLGVSKREAVEKLAEFHGIRAAWAPVDKRIPRLHLYQEPAPPQQPLPTKLRKRPRGDDEPDDDPQVPGLSPADVDHVANALGLPVDVVARLGGAESGFAMHRGRLAYKYPGGLKVRNPDGAEPRFVWVEGKAQAPWRSELIRTATKCVVICEGESDAAAAIASGIENTGEVLCLASPGTSFREEWAPRFAGKDVVLAFDADDAGARATERVLKILGPIAASVRVIDWSSRPDGVKDLRDLFRASGATAVKEMLTTARDRSTGEFKTAGDLRRMEFGDDPNSLIGFKDRWLGRGGSFIIVGASGIGKSTVMMLMAVCWSAGVPFFGIAPRRPLKVLIVQAENDNGDLREMLDGAIDALGGSLSHEQLGLVERNLILRYETERTGVAFCKWLEPAITHTCADLVLADPLLSYLGDDISNQKACSEFLRTNLNPVLHRTGAMIGFVHHTGKTSADPKARKDWTESDGAYLLMGSSEITNWARSIMTLVPVTKDSRTFKLAIAKRGKRAGMTSRFTDGTVRSIFLAHAEVGLGWREVEAPEPEPAKTSNRKRLLTDDDVLKAIGHPSVMIAKDRLVAELMATYGLKCDRTVRNTLNELFRNGLIEIAKTEPRPGGGPPVQYVRCLPS